MAERQNGKLVILSAPSGSGKTTIMKKVLRAFPRLEFSISATSRAPRHTEKDGADYYFISADTFRRKIEAGEFAEWEEVYSGLYYGTLRSEMERIWQEGKTIIFDVDVKGGMALKERFGDAALSIFIMPPSISALRERLERRGTDAPETIEKRLAKAAQELVYAERFDRVIVNDDLTAATVQTEDAIRRFIE